MLREPRTRHQRSAEADQRDQVAAVTERSYEDIVDLTGEVRQADLDGSNFALRLESGVKVTGTFRPDDEALITDALRDHESRRVRLQGMADFSDEDGTIRRITRIENLEVSPVGPIQYDSSVRPIWEVVAEMGSEIADEEWSKVPSDLASNLENYLRGDESRG